MTTDTAVVAAFRTLARARGARAFHPRGVWFDGTVTEVPGSGLPVPPGTTRVIGRLSKGVGTPGSLPDVLGLAIRLPEGPWDLALSSSGSGSVTRMLPLPARSWTTAHYGSIMPYRWDNGVRWLRAVPAPHQPRVRSSLRELADVLAERPLEFTVQVSTPPGGWLDIARLAVRTLLTPQDDPVAFDPMANRPPGWRMAPELLGRVRESAYVGSRLGRHPSTTSKARRPRS